MYNFFIDYLLKKSAYLAVVFEIIATDNKTCV